MSTKIYNGFRFRNPNMITIRKQLVELQEPINAFIQKRCAEFIGRTCAVELDTPGRLYKYYGERAGDSVAMWAKRGIETKLREASKSINRDLLYDFKASITVFPIGNKVLGMYFSGNRQIEDIITSQKWFIDYHYQNQSDEPENINPNEWKQRERDWDTALEVGVHRGIPANTGFDMTVSPPYWEQTPSIITAQEIIKEMPNHNERAENIAVEQIYQERHVNKVSEVQKDHSKIFEMARKWNEFEKSAEYKKLLKQKIIEIKKTIKKSFTSEDLLGKP